MCLAVLVEDFLPPGTQEILSAPIVEVEGKVRNIGPLIGVTSGTIPEALWIGNRAVESPAAQTNGA